MSETLGGGHESPEIRDDLVQDRSDQVAEHRANLHRLRTEFAMPLDFLKQMYGEGVVDPAEHAAEAVERWLAFLDTLETTNKKMVAIAEVHKELRPGCYGFGARPQYDAHGHILIITNPKGADVRFESDKESVSAVLEATGHELYDGSDFYRRKPRYDSFEHPRDIEQPIAGITRNVEPYVNGFDMVQAVVAGDTYDELHEALHASYTFGVNPNITGRDIATVGAFRYLALESVVQDACDATGRDIREERRLYRLQRLEK